MLETMIIRPLPLELSEDDCRKYRRISDTIRKGIQRLDEAQQNSGKVAHLAWRIEYPSFDSFLDGMQLSWSDYVLGLRASVQRLLFSTSVIWTQSDVIRSIQRSLRCKTQIWMLNSFLIPILQLHILVRT
jgi:hypothetical protein